MASVPQRRALDCAVIGALCLSAALAFPASAAERVVDAFDSQSPSSWRVTAKGANLVPSVESGYVDDDGSVSLRLEMRLANSADDRANRRWLLFDRALLPDASWRHFDGLAFDIRCEEGGTDFLMPTLWAGTNECFRPATEWLGVPRLPQHVKTERMGPIPEKWTTFRMPFEGTDPASLTRLRLGGGIARATTVLFRNLRLYADVPERKIEPCVTMSVEPDYVGNPSNTFQPGQRVRFALDVSKAPADAAMLEWEIRDNDGVVVVTGRGDIAGNARQAVDIGALPSGYYETRVMLIGRDGRRLSDSSALKTSGTMPKGVQSFAVVPCAYHETIERMSRTGDEFFGIMNSREQYRAAELTGAPWGIYTPRIHWDKPDSAAASSQREPWRRRVTSFCHWAETNRWYAGPRIDPVVMRTGGPGVERYKKWIADMVRANAKAMSHMKERPYELCWEPDLACPPFGDLRIEDLVEWVRIVREIVKENDPKAVIWGPKCTHNPRWYEQALEAGIGKYLDAVSMHLYTGPVPENENMPQRIRRIRELARLHVGRDLDVCNTESGYYRQPDVQTQAKKMIRYATILKGEGVRTFLLFFIFDFWEFGHVADYGLFYNPTWPLNTGPKQIYPKPMLPAYATMAKFLTGKRMSARLGGNAEGFVGYAFSGDGRTVLVMWSPHRPERVSFKLRGHGVTVTDLMGVDRYVNAVDGCVALDLGDSPVYVSGAEEEDGRAPDVVRVARAVEFLCASPESRNGEPVFVARFRNTTGSDVEVPVSLATDAFCRRAKVMIGAGDEAECALPLAGGCRTDKALRGRISWRAGGRRYAEPVEACFLRAFTEGAQGNGNPPFSNVATISGKGLDGTVRKARIELSHSSRGFHVRARIDDPVHSQQYKPDSMWMGDSLQLAFDTAPSYAYEYDEAIMQTKKKVSDICIGLTPDGLRAFRHHTYSEKFLPTGEIPAVRFGDSRIRRQDGATVYDLLIPWSEMGLGDSERPTEIGFSLLVNDRDKETCKQRAYYGLFGGIADGSSYRNYGRIVCDSVYSGCRRDN